MHLRRVVVGNLAVGLSFALALTSCTSDGGSSSASSSASASGANRALAVSLQTAVGRLTSAHFEISGTVSGQRLTGSGDQKIDGGKLTGLQAQASLPTLGAVGIVVDAAARFVKVPPPLATAAKPWLRVSADSKNLVVKQFAGVLDAALAAADLGGLADLAAAATSVRKAGSERVAGTPATRYAVVVDPAKLPHAAAAIGTADIPVDLWIDAQGRPLQVHATVPVVGQPADVTVSFSKFDVPVTIAAPPASQIAAG